MHSLFHHIVNLHFRDLIFQQVVSLAKELSEYIYFCNAMTTGLDFKMIFKRKAVCLSKKPYVTQIGPVQDT